MTTIDFTPPSNFIRQIIAEDLKVNKNDGRIATRGPGGGVDASVRRHEKPRVPLPRLVLD